MIPMSTSLDQSSAVPRPRSLNKTRLEMFFRNCLMLLLSISNPPLSVAHNTGATATSLQASNYSQGYYTHSLGFHHVRDQRNTAPLFFTGRLFRKSYLANTLEFEPFRKIARTRHGTQHSPPHQPLLQLSTTTTLHHPPNRSPRGHQRPHPRRRSPGESPARRDRRRDRRALAPHRPWHQSVRRTRRHD